MALQNDYTYKGVNITASYQKIEKVSVNDDEAVIFIRVFKDSASASDPGNTVDRKSYVVTGADLTTYFLTVHATDNVVQRAETYMIDKIAEYSTATVVA